MKKLTLNCPFNRRVLALLVAALAGVATARADYQSTVLGDSPLAYYPLGVGFDTGTVATDLSGNNNNGNYINTYPGFNDVPGPSAYITNGISFDGLSSYVDLGGGSNPSLLNFSGPVTMEAWVNPNNPSQNLGDILAKGYDSGNNYDENALRLSSGRYESVTYNGTAQTQGAVGGTPTTSWTHVVGTFNGTVWKIYVNGQLVGQNGDTVGILNFSAPWRIGSGSADGANRFFSGSISQVALYNYALSASQVFAHYFAGQYGVTPDSAKPIITSQPAAQSVYAGGTVRFSVGVLSSLSTTNQWFKDATPLLGQTNATLTLFNVQASDVANYSVVIGNSNGATNSAPAALALLTPPTPTVGNPLVWSTGSGVWDNGASANWKNLTTQSATVFNANDSVLFDDTAGVPTAVTLNDVVSPSYITNNSSANNFVISGSGDITGAASLVKLGNSTLEISTANDFSGSVTIRGGTVQMDSPLSGSATSLGAESAAPIVVTNGATLAIKASGNYPQGNSGLSTRQIVVSGAGVGGNGALRSIGNDIYHDGAPRGGLFRSLQLTGDATIGNPNGRWDLGDDGLFTVISSRGSNYNLTCLQGGYSEWHEVTIDPNLGNIDYVLSSGGDWAIRGMGSSLGNPTNVLTLHSGVNMNIYHGNNNDDNGYAKIIHVQTNAQFIYRPGGGAGDYHLATSLQLDAGASMNFYNGDGGNNTGVIVGGKVVFNGLTHLSIGDSPITFTNLISGSGGFYWDTYNNVVTFTADNTYAGPTVLGDGRTLALTGTGAISHSALIFFGGTSSAATRIDVSSRTDGTLTLANGQTLAGIGGINGNLTVSSGAVLSPAGTNSTLNTTNAVGQIVASGDIVLQGTTVIKLNGSSVNDSVQSLTGGITCGGTLNLINISGSPLAVGDSFQILFANNGISGAFTLSPTTPGPGLAWDISQLNNGIISVVASTTPTAPTVTGSTISGGNFIFSGSNGTAGNKYVVLTATNIATPLANWTPLTTNTFEAGGAFHVTNAVDATAHQRFYSIQLQ